MKIYLFTILFLILGVFVLSAPNIVFADSDFNSEQVTNLKDAAKRELNKGNIDNPQTLIGRFIKVFIIPMGFIALALTVYAGIMYMTSAGNAERVGKSFKIIAWVFMGMIAMLMSYMVVSSLFEFLSSK